MRGEQLTPPNWVARRDLLVPREPQAPSSHPGVGAWMALTFLTKITLQKRQALQWAPAAWCKWYLDILRTLSVTIKAQLGVGGCFGHSVLGGKGAQRQTLKQPSHL